MTHDAPRNPPEFADDADAFAWRLDEWGLQHALRFLNERTPHRFTGVYRFDGDMLRNMALVDQWLPGVTAGDDVPIASAYCAHVQRTGEPLVVDDGRTDPRVPWMNDGAVVSYCGVLVGPAQSDRWGALCHFDTARCDAKASEIPLLEAAAGHLYDYFTRERKFPPVPT